MNNLYANATIDNSAIDIVDQLLHNAIGKSASDIHLEPTKENLRVRFRLDGILHDQIPLLVSSMPQIISRLKVLSHMNIAEKRIPQDGKLTLHFANRIIDLRLSTFPSLYGEKIVIRILDRAHQAISLDALGFNVTTLPLFKQLIKRQQGFLLVTGPTGSGKTTTLYAALGALNNTEKNIVTLEDPVEYNMIGITQGYINPEAGFTFEKGIRALLRQDPDILMVGEIRDKQTARIAIEAAMTGHLVLTTLHTNDAPSAIMRLIDMGIEPFLINASLTGVLAQRLIRTICSGCRIAYELSASEQELCQRLSINSTILYKGTGCSACNYIGLKGRTGIFELLEISHQLRTLIVDQPDFDTLHSRAMHYGMTTLMQDALHKLTAGIISLEEFARIML